jgi:hypothetical protein
MTQFLDVSTFCNFRTRMSGRKRAFTKREALDILDEYDRKFSDAATHLCEEFLGGAVDDESSAKIEKLTRTINKIKAELYCLQEKRIKRKLRHDPAALDEVFASASQYSGFSQSTQSTESIDCDQLSQELAELVLPEPKKEYKKRPITDPNLSSDTRRRRVKEMRGEMEKWCQSLGCSIVQLCGLFIHLESYTEQRATSRIGWNLFTGVAIEPLSVSVIRALWIMERLGLSKAKYTELRLHFFDLIHLPADYKVLQETRKMRPELSIYHHGVRASLSECLALTLIDHLTVVEKSHDLGPEIGFSYIYGQDGSGCHKDYTLMSKKNYSTCQIFPSVLGFFPSPTLMAPSFGLLLSEATTVQPTSGHWPFSPKKSATNCSGNSTPLWTSK